MQRLMIRVSAMNLTEEPFTDRMKEFCEYFREESDCWLGVVEDKKMNGDLVHLHTHVYLETTYSKENVRKVLKKIFPESQFKAEKGKGHKPMCIQVAIKPKEECFAYLLKCKPPKIFSTHNVEEELIQELTGVWKDMESSDRNIREAYMAYMTRQTFVNKPPTSFGVHAREDYIQEVVSKTVEFFLNIIEKPFAMDLIEKYSDYFLLKSSEIQKDLYIEIITKRICGRN